MDSETPANPTGGNTDIDIEEELKTGLTFENVDKAKEFIAIYNEKNFTNFVTETNNKRNLVYVCKHSVHRDSESTGKREGHHYNYLGCTARIRMYKTQKAN